MAHKITIHTIKLVNLKSSWFSAIFCTLHSGVAQDSIIPAQMQQIRRIESE